MAKTYDENLRIVVEHAGQRRLPLRVGRAIRAMTRQRRGDAATWIAAARCLRHTAREGWAYRCYRRAARLSPDDLALAEEIGLFGATVLRRRWSNSWPRYLVLARKDPSRRERIDPILVAMAGRLPAELCVLAAVACLLAVMFGAWVVRRFQPIGIPLADGLQPFPPVVGPLAAGGLVLAAGALLWPLLNPRRRFGGEVLRRALWPPRVVHVLAVLAALTAFGLTLMATWSGADHDTFEQKALLSVGADAATLVLAFLGLPRGLRLSTLVQVVGESLKQ